MLSKLVCYSTQCRLRSEYTCKRSDLGLCSAQVSISQKQEGHDGPVSLHWLICEIRLYQTLHYLGIGLKHKTPYKD